MSSTTRRAALAGAGALVVGTVAAVTLLRKPRVPVIHTPVPHEMVTLQPVTALKPTNPPAPPPEATFTDDAGTPHQFADFVGKG